MGDLNWKNKWGLGIEGIGSVAAGPGRGLAAECFSGQCGESWMPDFRNDTYINDFYVYIYIHLFIFIYLHMICVHKNIYLGLSEYEHPLTLCIIFGHTILCSIFRPTSIYIYTKNNMVSDPASPSPNISKNSATKPWMACCKSLGSSLPELEKLGISIEFFRKWQQCSKMKNQWLMWICDRNSK